MSYNIVAAGGSLYQVTSAGVATTLTLPTDVTLSSTRPARMAVLNRNVLIVNGPTKSLWVTPDSTVRTMILKAPSSPLIMAAGASGGYTGTVKAKYTFIIKDIDSGKLLAESDFSPASATLGTVTSKLINITGIAVSPNSQVTHRRLYRTATGPGTAYFHWFDLEGNTLTAGCDDTSDAALALEAAPTTLGGAPGMSFGTFMPLLVEWKGRLWGVGDIDVDTLLFSAADTFYAWPAANSFDIAPLGKDSFGITGLMRRRDELGVAKRDIIWKIVGTDETDFQPIKVREGPGKGCWAPDSVQVIDDVAYFLGETGVYSWGPEGVSSISDDRVHGWFASDTYFNRAQWPNTFSRYNPKYHTYELCLCAAGGTTFNRWVTYDIERGKWWGPHVTTEFTPSVGGIVVDSNNLNQPVFGTTGGYLYTGNSSTFLDGAASVISMSLTSKPHDANTPDIEKVWLQPSVVSKIQAAAGTCNIVSSVGGLNFPVTNSQAIDLTKGRQRLNLRLGRGRFCQVQITDTTSNQGCEIYGYQIPVHEAGRH